MKGLIARLIAYLLAGSLCVTGPVLLIIALGSALQRAALIYSGLRADGTVIAKRQSGSSRATYAPVFQFTASDGRSYTVSSDVYGRESAFRYGERVRVLYREGSPQSARIDAFAALWTLPLVCGGVGAAFSVIPALVVANWLRRRRASTGEPQSADPAQIASPAGSPGFRWALGLLLTGGGLALIVVGLSGEGSADPSSLKESRVFLTSLGVLLAASGPAAGQWVATGSRLYRACGATAITAMAVIFGWVAVFGEASGFSGGVSVGGMTVKSGGSVTLARIAFGMASIVIALASLWAWKLVFRQTARNL